MKREPRYTVLKNTDAEKHLDGDEISLLVALCDKALPVRCSRRIRGGWNW